jgi:hypothetical protein
MSVAGYLGAGKTDVRMPKKGVDELGIRFEGAVLTGEKSVGEGLREGAVRAKLAADEHYGGVEDYDPVLRSHCG